MSYNKFTPVAPMITITVFSGDNELMITFRHIKAQRGSRNFYGVAEEPDHAESFDIIDVTDGRGNTSHLLTDDELIKLIQAEKGESWEDHE